jgi:hypothetical protein
VKAFPTNPDAPLPNDPKAERVAIPVAHLFFASLSHWVYPYTLAMFKTNATPTIINQENLKVIRQEKANNAQRAGVPYNVHQNNRVSAELFTRLGYAVISIWPRHLLSRTYISAFKHPLVRAIRLNFIPPTKPY